MALLSRQNVEYVVFDDQGPTMWSSFVGSWTHYLDATFYNSTITATPTVGDSISFSFTGIQAWLYGSLSNANLTSGEITSYPTADYKVNGIASSSQAPWIDSTVPRVVYFRTPELTYGTHKIDIVVTSASSSDQFILDYFQIAVPPSTGVSTGTSQSIPTGTSSGLPTMTSPSPPAVPSTSLPTAEKDSTPAIVGGVVGGVVGIAILFAVLLMIFLKKVFKQPTT